MDDELQVAQDLLPHCRVLREVRIRLVALQSNEVEMTNDRRLQRLKHIKLSVEIRFKDLLVCSARRISCAFVGRPINVDGYTIQMMHRPDE